MRVDLWSRQVGNEGVCCKSGGGCGHILLGRGWIVLGFLLGLVVVVVLLFVNCDQDRVSFALG